MGPGDLAGLIAPLRDLMVRGEGVLVGPETADDAGVYLLDGIALVATADFIPPVCDDARAFGRIAAVNALSDVYAMGGKPLFALNLCCFPERRVPPGALTDILRGGGEALAEAGAALLGGHSVSDPELKYGLAVIGRADPDRLLTNAGARPGDRLILTKPLGTGVMINAFRADKLSAEDLQPALDEMSRLNAEASRLALAHDARAATDVTGFGLSGHAAEIARASDVALELDFGALPVYEAFRGLVGRGVTTGCTRDNRLHVEALLDVRAALDAADLELLFDPQTSGGLLLSAPAERSSALLAALVGSGHRAAEVGKVLPGPPRLIVV